VTAEVGGRPGDDASDEPGDDAGDHRTVRIGITGPIGCGKTRVARWLGELGAHVVDADAEARAVTSPGGSVHDAIVRRWPDAAGPDGALDRGALGRTVFADPAQLRELESLVHPAVRPRVLARIAAAEAVAAPAIAIEAIKLVEGGLASECDEVWLVTCDPDVQRERLIARGTDPADAEQRVAAQAGLAGRLSRAATLILDTSGAEADTRTHVEDAFRDAMEAHRRGL
jgi:dephospho-CoA kinase